jgi:hypothetical protein
MRLCKSGKILKLLSPECRYDDEGVSGGLCFAGDKENRRSPYQKRVRENS